jgi:glycosyltransferase involved in cell wall biosynthesis
MSIKTPLKLALLTDGIYPFVIGGMQKHSFYLAKFLALKGVEITLVHCVMNDKKAVDHQAVLEAMQIEDLPNFKSHCLVFPAAGNLPGHYLKESYKYSRDIFDWLKPTLSNFDFIYSKGFSAWYLLDQKKRGLATPPVSVKFHGYEMFQKPPSFRSRLEHLLLRGPVKFVNGQAEYVFSYGGKITPIIKKLGTAASQIIEIPTGIESSWITEKFAPYSNGPKNFLFLGRYERRKGIEELNQVLEDMLPNSDMVIHFVGPIPIDKQIKSTQAIYHGAIMDSGELRSVMDQCHIQVVPSHSEGMPNVIMEGMARGLAIIASDVGAVADQVDATTGWLIEGGNKTSLKTALIEALSCAPPTLNDLRTQAFAKVRQNFTWEHVSQRTLDALESLIVSRDQAS